MLFRSFRQVFLGLVALTVGLTALTWLIQSLRFVETVINHGLSFLVFLHLTSLLIPSLVAYILPIAPYFVTEFTFYRLAGDRELTVMRAAGLSQFALARPAILGLALFIFIRNLEAFDVPADAVWYTGQNEKYTSSTSDTLTKVTPSATLSLDLIDQIEALTFGPEKSLGALVAPGRMGQIIAGTFLPFEGTNLGAIAPTYYSPEKDARRQAVNEFIRTSKAYDGVIDFEAALRDPGHPLQLLQKFKGADNLHLTDSGYQTMAETVNLALLRR